MEGRSAQGSHCVLLPHEIFAAVAEFGGRALFEKLFTGGADNLRSWWEQAEARADPWFVSHPVLAAGASYNRCVPLGIHGDDCGIGGGHEKALMVSWGSVAVRSGTLDSRILFSIARLSEMVLPHHVFDVMQWSFNCLASGYWPAADHDGNPWPENSDRAKKAGQPLTSEGWPVTQCAGEWPRHAARAERAGWDRSRACRAGSWGRRFGWGVRWAHNRGRDSWASQWSAAAQLLATTSPTSTFKLHQHYWYSE